MPTLQRRMALTLPPDVEAAVFDLADALGKPASKVVTELLQECIPQLQGLAQLTRQAKAGNRAGLKQTLQHMVGDAAAALMASQQDDLFPKKKAKKSLPPAKVQAHANTHGRSPK